MCNARAVEALALPGTVTAITGGAVHGVRLNAWLASSKSFPDTKAVDL